MNKSAVVIVNYNDSDRIIKLVKKLESYNLLKKIVISDNGSSEEDKLKLNKIENDVIKVIYNNKNLGFSGANNTALKYLKNEKIDYVFTINSDVEVSKKTMKNSIDFLNEHNDIALVSAQMIENDEHKQCYYNFPTICHSIMENLGIIKIFKIKPRKVEQFDNYFTCDYIRSSYWCVKYKDFYDVGFFDENTFLYHVETCVGIKLSRKNKNCAILENDNYFHNHIYKKGYKLNGYKDSYKSLLYIFKKYYNKNDFEIFFFKISFYLGLFIRKILFIK